ncbi:MAG: NADH-quinone oxidoreductase subunit L [Actinobacteria bacterium]|nr:MAG: NADH-quinone oxidoreductase subunit L [Actinomycetota bacterium]
MTLLALIPLIPVASFIVIVASGRRLGVRAAYLGTAAMLSSLALSVVAFLQVEHGKVLGGEFLWLKVGGATVKMGLQADGLSAVMLLVITIVSVLVHLYSIGYMHGEERFGWYYAVLSLFSASMLGLVLANNYLQMYMFWEVMGLCSYLLIGFWFTKPEATEASKKAFIVTRVGDVGFGLGIIALFTASGSFVFSEVFHSAESWAPWLVTFVTLLLFCGAIGKSAQFPLHVWLPDAMAGPTPASALIHAATMVAAGVYLVARSFPLFEHSETALSVVLAIGAVTAIGAALMAVVQLDIKKVLAYSTISQLGYMMMGLGAGSLVAGMWHLTTHAFFKALLFLGSGSVIHATHSQDIREMGGLHKKMRITSVTFFIGSLALAGIFPFSGFFSKDEILLALFESHNYVALVVALTGAFLTAFYMGRLCFVVFFGKPRGHADHAHESPPVMTVPLVALATLTAVIGLAEFKWHLFSELLGEHAVPLDMRLALGSTIVAVLGIYVGYEAYFTRRIPLRELRQEMTLRYVTTVLRNKFSLDELYENWIVAGFLHACEVSAAFDKLVIDGVVNAAARLTVDLSRLGEWFDRAVVDGIVNGLGAGVMATGRRLRYVHTGRLQSYARWMYGTLIVIVAWLIIRGRL